MEISSSKAPSSTRSFVTRFAPTPNGPLHFGSLVVALWSYLESRVNKGVWLLRCDDLDTPRVQPKFISLIQKQLEGFGLMAEGNGPILQSGRVDRYNSALKKLIKEGVLFACDCSRAQIKKRVKHANAFGEYVYDGNCRDRGLSFQESSFCVRLQLSLRAESCFSLEDGLRSEPFHYPVSAVGDILLRRSDGFFSYHFANALDDHDYGVTHSFRGGDLLGAAQKQKVLSEECNLGLPRFFHMGLVVDGEGEKLSKSKRAASLEGENAAEVLREALAVLGVDPKGERSVKSLLKLGTEFYRRARVPIGNIPAPALNSCKQVLP